MGHPPSPHRPARITPEPAEALVRRAAAFGQDLAGTLRRASVLDLLLRHVRDALTPSEVTIGLTGRDADHFEVLHTWPPELPDRRPLLQLAIRRGPLLVADEIEGLLREQGFPTLPDTTGSWLIVPLTAKGRVTGAIAARAPERRFEPGELALLEAFAAQASIALESARLIDLHEDRRRSWQDVVDALSLALVIIDDQGCISRANREFARLVGAPPPSLIGRPWEAFTPPEWIADLRHALAAPERGRRVELRTGERSYQASAVPISDTERSIVVLLFEDQTEARRLQEQLVQSEKMSAIGQLIAGIAHDLNNPLASVVGFADFLGEVRDVPPQLREPLDVIREEAERASGIVKNLLSFARKQEGQRRSTSLKALLESTLVLLRNQLLATRVEWRFELEPDLPHINVDPNQLQQVFVNLINNAAQAIAATGKPGAIVIRTRRWMDGVAIDIIDNGPGMSESLAAHVFDPFFTTKGEGEGTGLGLSISQGIVKEHGGRISLTTKEGEGSTFTVHLPVTGPEEPPAPSAGAGHPVPRLRILVVDDEPHILHYMRATLETWGHTVEVAEDGDEAIERASTEAFDLVISDLRMPRLGGREFYTALERRSPGTARRLVFSTGDTVRGDTLAFLEGLGRPYLHKPFSLAELRTLLARIARGSGGFEVLDDVPHRDSGGQTTGPDPDR